MLANRPRGITLNKNALNLPNRGATPSPPKLKSQQTIRQQTSENDSIKKATLKQPLQPSLKEAQLIQLQPQQLPQLQPLQPLQTNIQPSPAPPPHTLQPPSFQQPLCQPLKTTNNTVISRIPRLQPALAKQPSQDNKRLTTVTTVTANNLITLDEVEFTYEQPQEEIEDIDKSTNGDAILLVCDVAKDIYSYMYELEEAQSIKQDFLKDQKIMTPKVRQRLINWCIDTHTQLELLPETLYMTIAVIDRFFDKVIIKQQNQVQLIALGAFLVASKYEEIWPPEIHDLMYLTQNAYSKREILRAEIEILERLEFNLGRPIPLAFLRRFSKAANCDIRMHSIAKFLLELSLSEYECSHWKPSLLAATALFITTYLVNRDSPKSSCTSALFTLKRQHSSTTSASNNHWNRTLVHYTQYSRAQLVRPAATLCQILKKALKSPNAYSSAKKNAKNFVKWPELGSQGVDDLIKQGA